MKFYITSKLLFLLTLTALNFRCTIDSKNNFPTDEFLKIYQKNEGSPTVYPFKLVIPIADNWIVLNNIQVYDFIYKPWNKHEKISYFDFLKKVLSDEIKLKFADIKEGGYSIVNKEQRIITEFNENGFDYIKDKYLIEENGSLVLNKELTTNEYYGLIKVMFYQGFIVMFDDLNGELIFTLPHNLASIERNSSE